MAEHFNLNSNDENQTEKIAQLIGAELKGGEVIELIGDIGTGKTVFVRGLGKGMGSHDAVASPSFTVLRIYRAGELELHHYDYYRLSEAGILANQLDETLQNPKNIVVVEWANIVKGLLPTDRLAVSLSVTGVNGRKLYLKYSSALSYLIKGIR